MRPASNDLIGFLFRKLPFWSADLFTIATVANGTFHWTSADRDITDPTSILFSSLGPRIARSRWSVKNQLDVPEMEIRIDSTGTDLTLGNLKRLAYQGLFDGATVKLERAFMPSPGDVSLGTVVLFSGYAGPAEINALGITLTVKGANVLLQQYMPRNLYSPTCEHALYDPGCTMVRADFTASYAVGASPSSRVIPWETPPGHPEYYAYGTMSITSGAGAGQLRTIVQADSTAITVAFPFYTVPAEGDAFTATYGCSRTRGINGEPAPNCTEPFANTDNFRGFPFVPPAELAL
jgi:uncharacterized phage protein (TIGR02218 family)